MCATGIAGRCVPLYVERLASLLASEEGSRRFEIIVVALPCHARPAGVTHPYEEPLPVAASRLIHRPVAVVVLPLGQLCERGGVVRLAESLLYYGVERRSPLCALHAVVVLSPLVALGPQCLWPQRACQSLVCHYVRHAPLRVQFARLTVEVFLRRQCPVRTVTAHSVVGGA